MRFSLTAACLMAVTALAGFNPTTTITAPAAPVQDGCTIDEGQNHKGSNQCDSSSECSGARTCSGYGWCQGSSNCPVAPVVKEGCDIDEGENQYGSNRCV